MGVWGHPGAATATRLDEPRLLQMAVRASRSSQRHTQITRDLPYGGKAVTGNECP
jgi:hypothetical protein